MLTALGLAGAGRGALAGREVGGPLAGSCSAGVSRLQEGKAVARRAPTEPPKKD